ncbi:MAG: DinB family protein [Actinomycetes bacterium]
MIEEAKNYQKSTEEFLNLVATLKPEHLDKADKAGWTPRQVIHHLADSETQSFSRLRRLIAEPGTTIQGYDENKWAESKTLGYKELDVDTSLAVFKAVRKASYELLIRITEKELDNSGTHTESGKYSVRDWIRTYSKHPLDHANQIKEQLK